MSKWADKLFFGEIIQLYLQAFFEFSFAIILTLKLESHNLIGEKISLVVCYFSLAVGWILMPLASLYIIFVE